MEVPKKLTAEDEPNTVAAQIVDTIKNEFVAADKHVDVKDRKQKLNLWDKMKHNIIELFKEEEDERM